MSARVLLIEDAEDIIYLISSILDDEDGYSLVVATDGEAGLMAVRAETPDLILLDMSLPKLSGWDLIARLRSEQINVPVIALTAHAMRDDRERALALGCTDYLAKPFEIDELLDVLERHTPKISSR